MSPATTVSKPEGRATRHLAESVGSDLRPEIKTDRQRDDSGKRDERWYLRDALRTVSRKVTAKTERLPKEKQQQTRFQLCGKRRAFGTQDVPVMQGESGTAYFAGVQHCGLLWVCPSCADKIRRHRSVELDTATRRHVGLERSGPAHEDAQWFQDPAKSVGGLEFVTVTGSHKRSDALAVTLDAMANGFRDVQRDRAFRRLREELPFGFVRALEITFTWQNGWHPHLHLLFFTETEWTDHERELAQRIVWNAWRRAWVARVGERRAPSRRRGIVWEQARSVGDISKYLTKMHGEGREWGPAAEMTRADKKHGRGGSLTPFELGLAGADGDRVAAAKWREYEDATHNRAALTWSRGLRDRLLDEPEYDDETVAQFEPVEAEEVAVLVPDDFRALTRLGLQLALLQAVERQGLSGFWRVVVLSRLRAGALGWWGSYPIRPLPLPPARAGVYPGDESGVA